MLSYYLMSGPQTWSIPPRQPKPTLPAAAVVAPLAAVALALVAPVASGQLATWRPTIPPERTLTSVRDGVFEVWTADRLAGTETYRVLRSASGDTLFAISILEYGGSDTPESLRVTKQALHITRALDQTPLFFQTIENSKGASFRASAAFSDTVVQVFQENDEGGKGHTMVVPAGKLYLLDPGVYQLIEFVSGEFARRGAGARKYPVFVLRSLQTIELQLTRGEEEEIEWPAGKRTRAIPTELTDGLTSFTGWFDGEGRMLVLEAPAYGTRVVRRSNDGAARR